jgi:hypothetical protein
MKTFLRSVLFFIALTLCGLSQSQLVTPQEQEGKYYFQVANVYFEVDPSFGARITSFKIDDEELLHQSTYPEDAMWGSTLWQSPQSEWNWPPSEELDSDPYSGGIEGNQVILRSSVDETYSHLVLKKIFSADASDTSVTMVYTMINKGAADHSYSAWEVSRVPAGGISFFPMGEGDIEGPFATQAELIGDIMWYEHDNSDPPNQKFFCDGAEGWSAHVNDDLNVFVKKWDDVPASANAPGEKEVELYHSAPTGYLELENQSAYTNIAVDDSVDWTMTWYLRHLPSGIDAQTGNTALVEYVRSIVGMGPSGVRGNRVVTKAELYPNPACDFVYAKGLPAGNTTLIITDISGRVLCRTTINNHEKVELTDINSGLYLYQIYGSGFRTCGKLILRK